MPVSVREIAEYAGVSKSTVSLVLNHKKGVSDAMRQLIFSAVKDLEVRQNQSNMVKERDNPPFQYTRSLDTSISLVVLHPTILRSSYVFGEVLKGIQTAAEQYRVGLRLIANEPNASTQHVANLYFSDPRLRPDGVIVFGAKQHEPLIEESRQLGIPCVVLGRDVTKYSVSGIGRQEDRYAYQATQYLIALGHRVIGFVGGQDTYDYVHNRIRGYQHALTDAQITPKAEWVQLGHGGVALEKLLALVPNVTAAVFVNDSYAAEGLPIIEQKGIRIPTDLSVISFDDTPIARDYVPPLTSVAYRRFEEGQWAVKMLIDQIHYPFVETMQVIVKGEFIVRESCTPPR